MNNVEAVVPFTPNATTMNLPSEHMAPRILPQILNSRDMTATFVVSIYFASYATTAVAAGPAAISYMLLVGLTFFLPCLIATAQLGKLFPYEGALYNWAHKAIGGYWSFFAGFSSWFPGVLISSSLANLLITYAHSLNLPALSSSWEQGVAISVVLLIGGLVSILRFRIVQNIINVLVGCILVAAVLIGLSGAIWLLQGHPSSTNLSNWGSWNIKPDNYVMFGLLTFAYIGTDGPLNMAGEITEQHVIKKHLFWGGLIICLLYLTNTLAVLLVIGPKAAFNPFAMVTVVNKVLGTTAGYITAVCLMGSFFATVLVYNYLYARLIFVAALDNRLPKKMGRLNKQLVPARAILFQTSLAIAFTVFTFIIAPMIVQNNTSNNFANQVYNISQAAAALIWTISTAFLFICLLGCCLRHPERLRQRRILPIPLLWITVYIGLISCLLTIVDTLFFSWTSLIPNTQWWYLVGSLMLIFLLVSAFLSLLARSEARWQTMYDSVQKPNMLP
ncbi:MAG TPA: APC family permease [Dictyobacter sp.]|jgi:amino acid transporter|nr:APC family permease [Dictyobacter sp.]